MKRKKLNVKHLWIQFEDFLFPRLRLSIRERGHCFYCLRRTDARVQCLDHVVPRARPGRNSYRNLVSSCLECNSLKRRASRGPFSSLTLPRAPHHVRRAQRPSPRP